METFVFFAVELDLFYPLVVDFKDLLLLSRKNVDCGGISFSHTRIVEFAHVVERRQHVDGYSGGRESFFFMARLLVFLALFNDSHVCRGTVARTCVAQYVMFVVPPFGGLSHLRPPYRTQSEAVNH